VMLLDVGSPFREGLNFAKNIVEVNPQMRVIFMIRAEDEQQWSEKGGKAGEFQFLIKTAFPRNLLYLLEGHA